MAGGSGVAIASLVFTAGATAISMQQQRRARKSQEEAQETQAARSAAQSQRARQQAVARARRRRAAVVAQGQAQGALGSSPVQGAIGALESGTAANLGMQQQLQGLAQQQQSAMASASRAQGHAKTFSALSQLPGQLGMPADKAVGQIRKSFQSGG